MSSIDLKSADGAALKAYTATHPRPRGSIVLLQEIFGVNAHIRSVAEAFARDGYYVLAPALFDRVQPDAELDYSPAGVEAGKVLRAQVSDEWALLDIEAAIGAAGAFGSVAVIGYCWGGRLAWLAASRCAGLSTAVAYYPGGVGALIDEQPKAPVLLHFGASDASIPLADVEALRARHPELPLHLYPAGHGFSCDARPGFDVESHARARIRTLGFLDACLE